ncbi:MAG: hypothetical protein LBT91_02320 [Bifidobacteriaceae bacterium]|jgi:DNA ligase (NAD+)|nr:hypothetical protein [Bifidobacteriaceae bacterium]
MLDEEFNEKINELLHAAKLYYHSNKKSPLSDEEYDLKINYLKKEVLENPALATDNYYKLLNQVAGGTKNANAEVHFKVPMLSLAKASDNQAVESFLEKTKIAGAENKGWILESKLDGVAIALRYKNGKLNQVITRSSGEIGMDITNNLFELFNNDYIYIKGLPLHLSDKLKNKTIELRGEIFMTLEQFQKTNAIRSKDSENTYNNPRNAVAGIINSKVSTLISKTDKNKSKLVDQGELFSFNNSANLKMEENHNYKSYATFLCYSYISDFDFDLAFTQNYGFLSVLYITRQILNYNKPYFDNKKIMSDIKLYGKKLIRDNDYGKFIDSGIGKIFTDGIVVKCIDDKLISQELGSTEHHPNSQIAYKYMNDDDMATTHISDIEISVGRTGRLSIRGKLSPQVHLYGSKIEYATLHNFDWLQKKDVRIGSTVAVIKANDVIPYIAAVLDNPAESKPYKTPEVCPLCETPLDKKTLLWRCPNNLCPSRGITALETAVSKNYLDIDSLSKKTLEAVYNSGLVKDIADIFKLSVDDLANLPTGNTYDSDKGVYQKESLFDIDWSPKIGKNYHRAGEYIPLGKTTAITIYNSIQKAKNIPFERLLASLNIPLLGKKIGKSLVKKFGTMDKLLLATKEELESVDLISSRKSAEIIMGLKLRQPLIKKLKSAGVNMGVNAQKNNQNTQNNIFENQIIVVSGSIPGYTRDEVADLIELLGGKYTTSVTSKTTLLVSEKNENSSKFKKALENNTKIIAPSQFLELINKTNEKL